jgi:signal transduction histidine kinase
LRPHTTSDPGQLIADLCHNVRTPLHGILGTLELLLDGDLDDESHELARVAYDSAVALHDVFERDVAVLQGLTDRPGPQRR